jgi:NAD(P)-dependent dehydrogenase (short-subunit alcohol dehydrogenase family)
MADMFRLDGRKALVTGASSGLGRHFAFTLARAGAEVVVAARRGDRLADLVAEMKALGAVAHAVSMDLTSQASVRAAFDRIEQIAGTVEVIVNNAGVTATKPTLQQSEEDWDTVMLLARIFHQATPASHANAHQQAVSDPFLCRTLWRRGYADSGPFWAAISAMPALPIE